MTCDECAELLGDAVDCRLTPFDEGRLREHIAGCETCALLVDDLRTIRSTAARLDRHVPPAEIWRSIEARTNDLRRSGMWIPLAAAAVLVITFGTSAWLYFSAGNRSIAHDDSHALATSAEAEIQQAQEHYGKAITALEQLTAGKEHALDPKVADAIAASLRTVDQAIADSRAALKSDPGSAVAQASLLEALRTKVSLLQQTVSLINAPS